MRFKTMFVFAILVVAAFHCEAADPPADVNLLMIGNSFTFRHDLPIHVQTLAAEGNPDRNVAAERLTYGGQSLDRHYNYYFSQSFLERGRLTAATVDSRIAKMNALLALSSPPQSFRDAGYPADYWAKFTGNIKTAIASHRKWQRLVPAEEKPWTHVSLQSWRDVGDSADGLYGTYARKFAAIAKANQITPILYMTADYAQNEDAGVEPIEVDRVTREMRIAKRLADEIDGALVVPVPLAVNMMQNEGARFATRYHNDGHPNQYCAYLTACLFYAAMFERSPVGLTNDTVTDTKIHPTLEGKNMDGGPLSVTFDEELRTYIQDLAWRAHLKFKAGEF